MAVMGLLREWRSHYVVGGPGVVRPHTPPVARAAPDTNWSLHKPLTAASMRNNLVIGRYT